jgi:hypothetical protein
MLSLMLTRYDEIHLAELDEHHSAAVLGQALHKMTVGNLIAAHDVAFDLVQFIGHLGGI